MAGHRGPERYKDSSSAPFRHRSAVGPPYTWVPGARGVSRAAFSPWMRRCCGRIAPRGKRCPCSVLAQGPQVGLVLAQEGQRALTLERGAVARHDRVGGLDQRAQPGERRDVGVERAAGREHRDLHGRDVVADHQALRPRHPHGHPVRGVAVGRMQLELELPDPAVAGDRQRLHLAERQRALARQVVLLVERAQIALRRAGLGRQSGGRRLGHPDCGLRERQAAEQVVPVGVRRQQAGHGKARLLGQRRHGLELRRQHGRVDRERLVPAPHEGAGRLPDLAGHDDDVGVDADRAHRRFLQGLQQLGRLTEVRDLGGGRLLAGFELLACGG